MLRIKEIAKSKGVSISELAEKLGVTRVGISKTINGNPTIETLLKIANVLEVDVRDLIEPTTSTATTPLYIKDDNGNLVEVGSLNKDKE
ncbi:MULTISPECIES: helix-turn-helix domain-containing protein [Capnocytophaga]|uniref:DNA-binding helix-turn-helix protein n=1 Tax=Capnocytophaga canis TaxID=1848903 RepID=A0A0B7IU64_9FLAO|nr:MULTISPECIES: helix-turn-helix transcriptional regulator [Capnocytophaga]AWL79343.1 XRE family transcriptional regulator [Capnocytophaga canimorsus]AYW35918.1 XRE family transcriptional regulator [Capnocytophaga canimorsus]MDT9498797.1 helix-turn-helix transcriptional regulator [Capnocytophaga canimorsus]RIY35545.1 XRE family transcriptional regulator [Capnocytophaga canis]CEN53493.1 DNA-binding helix-turn-helix protein [Capnocytophaga canis]